MKAIWLVMWGVDESEEILFAVESEQEAQRHVDEINSEVDEGDLWQGAWSKEVPWGPVPWLVRGSGFDFHVARKEDDQ